MSSLNELVGANARIEAALGESTISVERFHQVEKTLGEALKTALQAAESLESARTFSLAAEWLQATRKVGQDKKTFELVLDLHRRALAIRRRLLPAGSPEGADSLNAIGFLLRERGDLEGARRSFESVVAWREKSPGPGTPELAQALGNLGITLLDLGRIDEARPNLEQALEIRLTTGADSSETATSFETVGQLRRIEGDPDAAEECFRRALEINQSLFGSDHPRVALSLSNLGNLLSSQGDYERAQSILERALSINESVLGSAHPTTACSLNNLGALLKQMGRPRAARDLFERALRINEKVLEPGHPNRITTLSNLGLALGELGDSDAAHSNLVAALGAAEQAFGWTHPITFSCLHNLGRLHEALEAHQRLFAPDHPATAEYLVRLGSNTARRGDLQSIQLGVALLKRALEIRQRAFGDEHLLTADAHHHLGAALILFGAFGREIPEKHLRRALEIQERTLGADHPRLAETLRDLGRFLAFVKDEREAVAVLGRVLEIDERVTGLGNKKSIRTLGTLAHALIRTKKTRPALRFLARKLDAEEEWLREVVVVGSLAQKEALVDSLLGEDFNLDYISFHLSEAPDDERAQRLALTAVLRLKARVLDIYSEECRLLRDHIDPEGEEILNRLLALREVKSRLALRLDREAETDRREKIRELDRDIQKAERALARRAEVLPRTWSRVDLETVRRSIPRNAAVIELASYVPFWDGMPVHNSQRYLAAHRRTFGDSGGDNEGSDRYVAYVLRQSGIAGWADLGPVPEVNRAVRRLREAISERRPDVRDRARDLDKLTMARIRPFLDHSEELILAPDGELSLVPFAALVDEEGKYLVERFGLSYLDCGRDLLRRDMPRAEGEEPLVLGDPAFDGDPGPTTPAREDDGPLARFAQLPVQPLEGTRSEAEALGRLLDLRPDRVLTGEAANEAALKSVEGPHILHLATHGFFVPEEPAVTESTDGAQPPPERFQGHLLRDPLVRSGILLAGVNRRAGGAEEGASDDGVLTALELMGLDLRGTELAVLSACETGVGDAGYGQGVLGLRRSLVFAGARTQVLSLWNVDDRATQELMVSFYAQMADGAPRAEAMRQAQLAAIAGTPLPHTDRHLCRGGRRVEVVEEAADPRVAGSRHPYYWASFILSGDTGPLPAYVEGPAT